MTRKHTSNNQHSSKNMASTSTVTGLDLLRVVQALQANTTLCTNLAEEHGYDALEMQRRNELVSTLVKDLKMKMRAQSKLEKVTHPAKSLVRTS